MPDAITQGWSLGFLVSAVVVPLGLTIIVTMIRTNRTVIVRRLRTAAARSSTGGSG
jgi:Zn-dependent protease